MDVRWREGVVTAGRMYLYALLMHAGVSIVHTATASSLLQAPRAALAFAVIAASIPVYVAAGFLPGLPRRIFSVLPLFVWFGGPLVHAVVAAFTLPSTADLATSACGLLLAVASVRAVGVMGPERGVGGFSFRLAAFAGLTLVVVPVGLLAAILAVSFIKLNLETRGYLRVRVDGLYSVERVFRAEGREVRLVGMVHMGDAAFFRDLARSFDTSDTIVLEELVRAPRDDGPWRASAQQEQAAAFGLHDQGSFFLGELQRAVRRHADLDAGDLDPRTLEALAGASPESGADSIRMLAELLAPDAASADIVHHDALTRRNAHLLEHLDTALQDFSVVIVPWGAAHMPAFDAAVRERGFVPDGEVVRRVFAWSSFG